MHTTILTLWKQGKSKREIARITHRDRKTVSNIIKRYKERGAETPVIFQKGSSLRKYHAEIVSYLESNLSGVRVYEKLQELGCGISYSSVRRYIARLKISDKICVRFHSAPGEEAQVDFGYVGLIPSPQDGKRRKAWVFNMRLSYSRLDYYEVVFDQKVETFIQCHENAFRFFGGAPKVVKIDNLKAGILEAHFYEPIYQRLYKQFADYHGFYPLPCRVRQPQEKGKVESGIKYFNNNFMAGRQFKDYEDLRYQLREWIHHYCHERVHGTTKEKPKVLFDSHEKMSLLSLPQSSFYIGFTGQRKVHKDCHIILEQNFYSVPFQYVGEAVEVECGLNDIKIFYQDQQIALYQIP